MRLLDVYAKDFHNTLYCETILCVARLPRCRVSTRVSELWGDTFCGEDVRARSYCNNERYVRFERASDARSSFELRLQVLGREVTALLPRMYS